MVAVVQSFWNLHWDALSGDHAPLFCLQPPTFTASTQNKFIFLSNLHTVFLCNINLAVRTMSFQFSLFQNSSVTFSIVSWIHRTRLWREGERKKREEIQTSLAKGVHQTAPHGHCCRVTAVPECLLFKSDPKRVLQRTVKCEVSIRAADCLYDNISNSS